VGFTVRKKAKDPTKPVGERELSHVVLERAGDYERIPVSAFSPGFLDKAVEEGWIKAKNARDPQVGDIIEFKTHPPAKYRVTAARGRYCNVCDAKLEDDDSAEKPGALARDHVAAEHPDADMATAYECNNFVEVEKVS